LEIFVEEYKKKKKLIPSWLVILIFS
jgi:mitogen-activated protein kinase kinase